MIPQACGEMNEITNGCRLLYLLKGVVAWAYTTL